MTKQEFILTFISVAIFLVLLVPTLIYKIRRERKLPTGEPVPVTQGPVSYTHLTLPTIYSV
mgnify:CR=1 FL=1